MRPNKLNTRRRNLSISDANYSILKDLGDGNASQGLRNALHWAGVKPIPAQSQTRSVADW